MNPRAEEYQRNIPQKPYDLLKEGPDAELQDQL